ncbi:hypothetical protein AK812_SmicGene37067 [Symbiodinium microadriaticum]|uniref:C2H2-type domain-containing protein n=1 Tax=Symbiodinium microadriaticum TaxID=2951 RepID=A0A1Q9CH76_SYMMI|nr:hypothetical protein AK812_SmicGene37067 [Symbiodinium microadriaticum]CAE7577804.1 unnamed protein product [Symbiodinium sp. KB8]
MVSSVKIVRRTYRYLHPDGSTSCQTVLQCPHQGCGIELEDFQGLVSHALEQHDLKLPSSKSWTGESPQTINKLPSASQKVTRLRLPDGEIRLVYGACSFSCSAAAATTVEDWGTAIEQANAAYEVQRAFVQSLAKSGAAREKLVEAHDLLKKLKKEHADLVKAASLSVPSTSKRGLASYPPPMCIPRDELDSRFILTFSVDDAHGACKFMAEYGFVIFRDVLSDAECTRTRDEIWSYLEDSVPGFQRAEPTTWGVLSHTDTGRYYDAYGLPPDPVIISPQILRNRQSRNVIRAFEVVLGESILVSHDRWCLYRATQAGGMPTKNNLHLDLHPWRYLQGDTRIEDLRYQQGHEHDFSLEIPRARADDGPHVQGVLNLIENLEEDGGTQLVPGFHRIFEKWQRDLGDESDWQFKSGQATNWLHPGDGGASFKFHEQDPIHALSHRIPMRQGSLLLWDQRCVHGSRPNQSSRIRMAQFIRAFRRSPLSPQRARARARAIRRKIQAAGLLDTVSDDGWRVFGFADLDEPDP